MIDNDRRKSKGRNNTQTHSSNDRWIGENGSEFQAITTPEYFNGEMLVEG